MARPIYGSIDPKIKPGTVNNSAVCADIRQITTFIDTNISILTGILENKNKWIAKNRLDLLEIRVQEKTNEVLSRQ